MMTPEERQGVRRILGRQARELSDWLSKLPGEVDAQWHREATTALAHLRGSLGAELKVCPEGETLEVLRKKLADVASRVADDDTIDADAGYVSLRITIRDLRDEAHADAQHREREWALGLIYDAMGWTPIFMGPRMARRLEALDAALGEALAPESDEKLDRVRKLLRDGQFNVMPPIAEEEEEGA